MTKQASIATDGTLSISEQTGQDKDGNPTGRAWTIPPMQIKAHIDGMAKPGEAFADLKPGDRTAALDAYEQRRAALAQDAKNR